MNDDTPEDLTILQQDWFNGHLVTRFTDGVEVWHTPSDGEWRFEKVSPWDDTRADERSFEALCEARARGIKPRHPSVVLM